MKSRLSRATDVATIVIAICAVSVTGVVLKRELFSAHVAPTQQRLDTLNPELWKRVSGSGHRLGAPVGRVQIVEFGDYQCPFCARMEKTLASLRRRYPQELTVVYRHWPLDRHPFAYTAAKASLCAEEQGQFEGVHAALYANQDSIGRAGYDYFARMGRIPDVAGFLECVRTSARVPRIDADAALALEINATGTPAIVVNGIRFRHVPDSAALEAIVRDALAGGR